MGEEILVKDQLTDELLLAGRELTQRLSRSNLELVCALWLYDLDSTRWRFVFATPRIDTEGPLKVYEEVQRILKAEGSPAINLSLQTISAVSPNHPIVNASRRLVRAEGGFAEIKVSRIRVNGIFIEDCYIYYVR
jgi:hypothetical protein